MAYSEHVWFVCVNYDRERITCWSQEEAGVPMILEIAEGVSVSDVRKFLAFILEQLEDGPARTATLWCRRWPTRKRRNRPSISWRHTRRKPESRFGPAVPAHQDPAPGDFYVDFGEGNDTDLRPFSSLSPEVQREIARRSAPRTRRWKVGSKRARAAPDSTSGAEGKNESTVSLPGPAAFSSSPTGAGQGV